MRLQFMWWGGFWRGWLQWGRGPRTCADKDWDVQTVWCFFIGPLMFAWWNRPDWKDFCYTPEEAEAVDQEENSE